MNILTFILCLENVGNTLGVATKESNRELSSIRFHRARRSFSLSQNWSENVKIFSLTILHYAFQRIARDVARMCLHARYFWTATDTKRCIVKVM